MQGDKACCGLQGDKAPKQRSPTRRRARGRVQMMTNCLKSTEQAVLVCHTVLLQGSATGSGRLPCSKLPGRPPLCSPAQLWSRGPTSQRSSAMPVVPVSIFMSPSCSAAGAAGGQPQCGDVMTLHLACGASTRRASIRQLLVVVYAPTTRSPRCGYLSACKASALQARCHACTPCSMLLVGQQTLHTRRPPPSSSPARP